MDHQLGENALIPCSRLGLQPSVQGRQGFVQGLFEDLLGQPKRGIWFVVEGVQNFL